MAGVAATVPYTGGKSLIRKVAWGELAASDLFIDAVYEGGRTGNAGDDPFPRLLQMSNQGGFRYRGDLGGQLDLVVLTSTFTDPDWPDTLDRETGVLTYYGDNKQPGRSLLETGRRGNRLLQQVFEASHGDGRQELPPILVFGRTGAWRDVVFLGLAVPGVDGLATSEDLVSVWKTSDGLRFENYRARFTILDTPVVSRQWLDSIILGAPNFAEAPAAWRTFVETGRRRPLMAPRSVEYRSRLEQLPSDRDGAAMLEIVRRYFASTPHDFEHCAAAIVQLMLPGIAALDVTRPSRDGGRDGVGLLRIGAGPASILVDFAIEAKCYSGTNSVGVREISRLISRLRHRQFGILVTTSWIDAQAYREIKEDRHPIIVISGSDIVSVLRANDLGTPDAVARWLAVEFPHTLDLAKASTSLP